MPEPRRLALVGYGRMGREIESVARARGHEVVARIHTGAADPASRRISRDALAGADAVLEFTRPDAVVENFQALAAAGARRVVIGTTGWTDRLATVESLAREQGMGVVWASNFSLGVNLFLRVVERATHDFVAHGYDPWLVEWHHRGKRDAPSGTARTLAQAIEREAPGRRPHEGSVAAGIPAGTFQVAGVRAGAIPGTHAVGFESEEDSIELRHTARGRRGFALGAVLAAEWLMGDRRGTFTFGQVLEEL